MGWDITDYGQGRFDTLGLFLFVINALMFWAAAGVLDGFHVNGFWAAMLGSLIYSALMLVVDAAVKAIL